MVHFEALSKAKCWLLTTCTTVNVCQLSLSTCASFTADAAVLTLLRLVREVTTTEPFHTLVMALMTGADFLCYTWAQLDCKFSPKLFERQSTSRTGVLLVKYVCVVDHHF